MSHSAPFFTFFPQFTQDALNDEAWGSGFTDWDLISKLPNSEKVRFLPAKGMYDPTTPDYLFSLEQEVGSLSPKAGLAVYHYFFDGRHVLPGFEKQLLLQRSRLPFFICWANETWSKRWVGKPKEIIIAQRHELNEGIIRLHAEYLVKLFDLEGYQRYQGRPLLLIYNPQASSALPRSLALYRKVFLELGHEPFIGVCISHPQPLSHMEPYDFGCEFEPRFFFNFNTQTDLSRMASSIKLNFPWFFEILGSYRDKLRKNNGRSEFDYADYLDLIAKGGLEKRLRSIIGSKPLMRSTFLTWNNFPRYRERNTLVSHVNVEPQDVTRCIRMIQSDSKLPLLVNSWNEWSEGAALEEGEITNPLRNSLFGALGLKHSESK